MKLTIIPHGRTLDLIDEVNNINHSIAMDGDELMIYADKELFGSCDEAVHSCESDLRDDIVDVFGDTVDNIDEAILAVMIRAQVVIESFWE